MVSCVVPLGFVRVGCSGVGVAVWATTGPRRVYVCDWLVAGLFFVAETSDKVKASPLVTKTSGVHDTSFGSNMKRDVYIRKELCAYVVLSSGTTMVREIVERMTNELTALVPFSTKIKVVAPSMCKCSVWIGGAMLSYSKFSAGVDLDGRTR